MPGVPLVLDHAAKVGVTAACEAAGISRTSRYRWVARAERNGLAALLPEQRRRSNGSVSTPSYVGKLIKGVGAVYQLTAVVCGD